MPFQKGHKKVGGKQKGTPNKATSEIKQAYKNLIENNLDNITIWLEQVAEKNPDRALGILIDLSEFVVPKLARTETKHEGELNVNITPIEFVKG
jgi:hypothetical protein